MAISIKHQYITLKRYDFITGQQCQFLCPTTFAITSLPRWSYMMINVPVDLGLSLYCILFARWDVQASICSQPVYQTYCTKHYPLILCTEYCCQKVLVKLRNSHVHMANIFHCLNRTLFPAQIIVDFVSVLWVLLTCPLRSWLMLPSKKELKVTLVSFLCFDSPAWFLSNNSYPSLIVISFFWGQWSEWHVVIGKDRSLWISRQSWHCLDKKITMCSGKKQLYPLL